MVCQPCGAYQARLPGRTQQAIRLSLLLVLPFLSESNCGSFQYRLLRQLSILLRSQTQFREWPVTTPDQAVSRCAEDCFAIETTSILPACKELSLASLRFSRSLSLQ